MKTVKTAKELKEVSMGDILKVYQGGEFHFEKVIELTPEILTEDMPEEEDAEISIQGIADNLKYEIVPTFKISTALQKECNNTAKYIY